MYVKNPCEPHSLVPQPDPSANVDIPRAAQIFRLKQVLLNLVLRSRESYAVRAGREDQVALLVADTAGPLRACAATLLELQTGVIYTPRDAIDLIVQASGKPELAKRHWPGRRRCASSTRQRPERWRPPCLRSLKSRNTSGTAPRACDEPFRSYGPRVPGWPAEVPVDASGRLLAELASRAPQPLTVILEPDGAYPPIEHLLRQLDRAREEGRAGLSESECEALVAIDRTGLEMAATSFARKREKQRPKRDRESGVGVNTWPCTRSISACCRSWRSRRLCCSSWPVNVLSTIRR